MPRASRSPRPLLHAIGLGVAHLGRSDSGKLLVRGAGALVAVAGVALAVI